MEIHGTGSSETFTVSTENLIADVHVSATHGFSVTPATIKAGSGDVTVTVTNETTLSRNTGRVILRSADVRKYVQLVSFGTPLEQKDLSQSPVYTGSDEEQTFTDFQPGENGYTVEFKVRTDAAGKTFKPFAVSGDKVGFSSYVGETGLGLYNGTWGKGISNPANGGTFYNNDGLYHTYRYAVTRDGRVVIYRDGLTVDTLRTADFALNPDWCNETGDPERNLIKNPGFEGEYDFSKSYNITNRIEGWDVDPWDQYNSYQDIVREERSNDVDQDNHVLEVHRYMWNAGWGAAQISQIVDVAPNEVYSFSALAKGGIKSDGKKLGSLRIEDMQNSDNKVIIPVTSDSYQTYASDFETQATTKQIRVVCYLERDSWGASISALKVDDVKLTGMSRALSPMAGFTSEGADLAYFTYDTTGAYAPLTTAINASVDTLTIDGTGSTETFTVSTENLIADVQVSVTHGFSVTPATIKAGSGDVTVTVTNETTLSRNTGRVILRSADVRKYVQLVSFGTPLEQKDLSQSPVYTGSDEEQTFTDFQPGENGYTVEFKVRTDAAGKTFKPFAVSGDKVGFSSYVGETSLGLYNGTWGKGISNPANGGTFYNNDGLYHTYRYAVTRDGRVVIYRDGLTVDTLRTADFALNPDWCNETGDPERNLIKNPGFEGEYDFSKSYNITNRIEGWDVDPWDQYNSYQDIVREERSNDVDQDNHVLEVHRYMWNAGWGAAQISQIVDVAPNEVYSFSALAKGGIKSDGKKLGSLRIEDMQNSDNNVIIPVTSDSYQTYASDFETRATTKQIRVVCYLERDSWGASISALKVDDVKLTGMSRMPSPMAGFTSEGADLAYFTYDTTGAYAPMTTAITPHDITDETAVDEVLQHNIVWRVVGNQLMLNGLHEGSNVRLYNMSGALVEMRSSQSGQAALTLPGRGIYVCTIESAGKKQTIKIMY